MQPGNAPVTINALLFDVDGTLADTEETHRQAFNYAFVLLGLDWEWTPPIYRDLLRVSGGRERIARYIELRSAGGAEQRRLHALVPAIHAAKTELYAELIGDGRCPLRPGIARLLDEARDAGVQVAIASTTATANVDALLTRHLGSAGLYRFTVVACADAVERKKPAPDLYRLVLAMLGRSAAECVAFEDSENGVRAAKSAGLFTVVTPSPWTRGGDFRDADLVLPHLGGPDRPLPAQHAGMLGHAWLGLRELEMRKRAVVHPDGGAGAALR
jgi:HAD superfamily hydrolase (TIGR01509 family)